MSKEISARNYKMLSGFGWGVGSAVINGVLDNMKSERNQNLDNYLILRPFPQFETGGKDLEELWTEYRSGFIPLAGIGIFVFGNKKDKDTRDIVRASGMIEEFEIAVKKGLKIIPIGSTGFVAKELWSSIINDFDKYYQEHTELKKEFDKLGDDSLTNEEIIKAVICIINNLNKK
jgi:hypothetical protein